MHRKTVVHRTLMNFSKEKVDMFQDWLSKWFERSRKCLFRYHTEYFLSFYTNPGKHCTNSRELLWENKCVGWKRNNRYNRYISTQLGTATIGNVERTEASLYINISIGIKSTSPPLLRRRLSAKCFREA